jgi:hypothetical protein
MRLANRPKLGKGGPEPTTFGVFDLCISARVVALSFSSAFPLAPLLLPRVIPCNSGHTNSSAG